MMAQASICVSPRKPIDASLRETNQGEWMMKLSSTRTSLVHSHSTTLALVDPEQAAMPMKNRSACDRMVQVVVACDLMTISRGSRCETYRRCPNLGWAMPMFQEH